MTYTKVHIRSISNTSFQTHSTNYVTNKKLIIHDHSLFSLL